MWHVEMPLTSKNLLSPSRPPAVMLSDQNRLFQQLSKTVDIIYQLCNQQFNVIRTTKQKIFTVPLIIKSARVPRTPVIAVQLLEGEASCGFYKTAM